MPRERGRHFDIENGVIEIVPWLKIMTGKKIPIADMQSVTLWGAASWPHPVVVLTLHAEKWDIIFEETSGNFRDAMTHFRIEQQLPQDWYPRAENGERFHLELTEH